MQQMLLARGADVAIEKTPLNNWGIHFTNKNGKRVYGTFSKLNWAIMFAYEQCFGPDALK